MKVTVRDRQHPDQVIREFMLVPQVPLPYPGTGLRFRRDSKNWAPKADRCTVSHYEWDFDADDVDVDIRMYVVFEK